MKTYLNYIKYWGQILLLPIYWCSFLFPRNKKIWLFGSTFGRRFADNPRYFYLFLSQNKQLGIRPIWISHSKSLVKELILAGYEAYWYKSLKGIWYCLRGKVYLYDNYTKDISFYLSGNAKKINLWHGIPLKKIQMDNKYDEVRHPKTLWKRIVFLPRRMSDEKASHYILSPSHSFASIFSSAFCTKRVIICGYPRCDSFTTHWIAPFLLEKEKRCLEQLKKIQTKRVLLYMPTFRESEKKFFDLVDPREFLLFLESHNYFLCVKLHPKSKLEPKWKKIKSKSFLLLDANTDPYLYISYSDALITDYSSIFFDYLLTDKPILFFCYDLIEYLEKSRKLYFSYEKATPGKKVHNLQELQIALEDWNSLVQETKKRKKYIKEKVWGRDMGLVSSYVLYQKIKRLL